MLTTTKKIQVQFGWFYSVLSRCPWQNYVLTFTAGGIKVNHCIMMPVAVKTLIWRLNVTKIQFILITLSKVSFFFFQLKSNILN